MGLRTTTKTSTHGGSSYTALDTFTDTNGTQLTAHTADTGNIGWQSGSTTWTIQSNTANNNPGLGSDTARTWEIWAGTPGIAGDVITYANTEAQGVTAASYGVVGYKYRLDCTIDSIAGGTLPKPYWGVARPESENGNYVYTERATATTLRQYKATEGASGTVTTNSVKLITLNEQFATDDLTGITEGTFDVDITIPTINDGQAGLVLCLDSESSPANFIEVAYDKFSGKVDLWKCVAGTYTSLISTTTTYAAGATLRAIVDYVSATDDIKVKVYYNGALIDSEQTIEDNGIAGNTRHGIMSVDSSNSLDNFEVNP